MKKIPYTEITQTKKIPKNSFVLNAANASNAFDNFNAKIWVTTNIAIMKIANDSSVKIPKIEVIIKNHKAEPIVTVMDLILGDESSILNRIDKND